MKINKSIIIIFTISLVLIISGCENKKSVNNLKTVTIIPSPTSYITVAPTITPSFESSTIPINAMTNKANKNLLGLIPKIAETKGISGGIENDDL